MAIAFDYANASGDLSGLTSGSWSHTCTGTDLALYVMLVGYHGSANLGNTVVTYNGISLTKVGGNQPNNNNNTLIWELVNPPVGTYTVSVSSMPSGFDQIGGGSISFTGVDQADPTPSAVVNGPSAQSVNVTGLVAGDVAIFVLYDGDNDNPNPTVGTKHFFTPTLNSYSRGIGCSRTGTGTVACSFTGVSDRAITAVRVKAAVPLAVGGGLTSPAASIAGSVANRIDVTGSIQANSASFTALINAIRASAALQAQSAAIAGSISETIVASGAVSAQSSVLTGIFIVPPPTSFVADLQVGYAAISGVLRRVKIERSEVGVKFLGKDRFRFRVRVR